MFLVDAIRWKLTECTYCPQVARIQLFAYMFYHVYLHYNQVHIYLTKFQLLCCFEKVFTVFILSSLSVYYSTHVMLEMGYRVWFLKNMSLGLEKGLWDAFGMINGSFWQVKQMHVFGYLLVMVVPSVLALMNLIWFGKILKGLKKQLAKRRESVWSITWTSRVTVYWTLHLSLLHSFQSSV